MTNIFNIALCVVSASILIYEAISNGSDNFRTNWYAYLLALLWAADQLFY